MDRQLAVLRHQLQALFQDLRQQDSIERATQRQHVAPLRRQFPVSVCQELAGFSHEVRRPTALALLVPKAGHAGDRLMSHPQTAPGSARRS
ncbi:hypothetical protein AVJ23_14880 [Pseudoponticoccus marisrubri]|uniref:Uncharacterized protein n=1 Tax=Pseudoponticoccus marisrubri TaxID=1685382 RepID=A0A0W7WHH0_9RHOB|nr:hypothetical protein AVJ23_14880 [Pseudoponticoccus marisrubri]